MSKSSQANEVKPTMRLGHRIFFAVVALVALATFIFGVLVLVGGKK